MLKETRILSVKKIRKGKLKIKYQAVPMATSYRIYYKKAGAKAKYKVVGKKNLAPTLKKLRRGKKYTVKVRAQYTGAGMELYGPWSNVKKVKVK